jgi:c-di-GMP-binding flagellar brake protein YcgR
VRPCRTRQTQSANSMNDSTRMMEAISHTELQDWHNFEIGSRREIASLLRQIGEKNQLVRMLVRGEQDVCVTTILDMDDGAGTLLLDCSIDTAQNLRILATKRIRFETTLDKIRIVFVADNVESASYDGRPALRCMIPATLIRLQRREYYRMETPVASPIRVSIPLLMEGGGSAEAFTVADISVGGLALLDNKLLLNKQQGQKLTQCSIALPDGVVSTTLVVRNATELTLLNGKSSRRIGCEFTDLSRASLGNVQRYITKLERERNARMAGLE